MAYQIDIPEEILDIARKAAEAAGVPVDRFLMRAILDALEDYEDNLAADEAMRQIAAGEDEIISAEEFWSELDDSVPEVRQKAGR